MNTLSPLVVIRVNDQDISTEDIRAIQSVKITMQDRKADTGEIIFRDPISAIYDSRVYRKGASLIILMGWSNAMEPRGPYIVKSQKPDYPKSGEPTLRVEFQDQSHRMNRRQRRRRFSNMSPSQIIQQIAQEHDLGFDIEDPENVRFTDDFPLLQANATDARLMQQLSERYGYVWGVQGDTLYFHRPIDLVERGEQSEIPVLSYRCNDWSLDSFSPEIKFSSGRRRRGAGQTSGNIDLLQGDTENMGLFEVAQAGREVVREALPSLGSLIGVDDGQDVDDDERPDSVRATDSQNDSADQQVERTGRYVVDRVRQELGAFRLTPQRDDDPDENEESEPGDESGAATPDNEEEAQRRAAGRVARASEIVEATASLSIASMRWRPEMAVEIAGVAERLTGRYTITSVTQTLSKVFTTEIKVKRQTFLPSSASRNRIAEAADADNSNTDQPSADGPPARTSPEEERFRIDREGQRLGRRYRVNGQDQDVR